MHAIAFTFAKRIWTSVARGGLWNSAVNAVRRGRVLRKGKGLDWGRPNVHGRPHPAALDHQFDLGSFVPLGDLEGASFAFSHQKPLENDQRFADQFGVASSISHPPKLLESDVPFWGKVELDPLPLVGSRSAQFCVWRR